MAKDATWVEEQQHVVNAGEREEEYQRNQTTSELYLQRTCCERIFQERDASHEHTVQRARVAEKRQAEFKNKEHYCISMTESFDASSRKRHQALGNSQSTKHWNVLEIWCIYLRKPPVLSVTGRKKPEDSQEKWSILKRNNRRQEEKCMHVSRCHKK